MGKRLAAHAVLGRLLRAFLVVGIGAGLALSVLSSPADLARGLAWLQAQVKADGSLLTASRVGASEQAACETANTLIKLAGSSSQVSAMLASLQGSSKATETLGCWQQLRAQLGQTVLASELDTRRITQQGWAPYEGFGIASAVDTGPALVSQLQLLPSADKAVVISWLQTVQGADGSFASAGRADLLATATILRGLQDEASRSTAAASVATKASSWLLARRAPSGGWASDVALTSLVYEAVHPYSGADSGVANSIESFLLSQQLADGSWAGDAYVTAVALRALALTAVTPVDPTAGVSATVRGTARDAAGQPLAGVSVKAQPSAGPAKTVLTDAAGKYQIGGIAPGAMTLVASLTGYQNATGQATVLAGASADFSPTLYASGATVPGGTHLRGVVRDYGTGAPLSGAAVQASGSASVNASTDAQGAFDLSLPAGAYTVTYSLSGYINTVQQAVLPAGAVTDGVILLKPVPIVSTLHGTVTDFQGAPIASATVAVQGGPSTSTNSAGAYALSGVNGLQFTLQANAGGYAARAIQMSIPQAGDYAQDIRLPSISAGYLALSQLTLSSPTAGLRGDISVSFTVTNPSASAATAMVSGQILDGQGTAIATLAGLDLSGQPFGTLMLQPGGSQALMLKWNTAAAAPGNYAFVARLQEPGSVTRESPLGIVLDSQQRTFAVTAGPSFAGSVTANPPVLRAGTNTPVKLSALIQNDGNVPLPALEYQFAAIDTKTNLTAMTQKVTSDALPVKQLRTLMFSDWTPQAGGNFRLELTAASVPGVKVIGSVYVGDSGSAAFTVDKNQVPAGDQKVRGTVTVTGQSVVNGTINDPLVPLVKSAITRAVTAADKYSANHYPAVTNCFACHVQTQAIVGGERNLKYVAPANPLTRAVLMSNMAHYTVNEGDTSMTQQGATADAAAIMYRDLPASYKITDTTLGLWAQSQWHDPGAVNYSKVRLANFLLKNQLTDGSWTPDHPYTWWGSKSAIGALNVASFTALKTTLSSQTFPFGKKLVPYAVSGLPQAGDKYLSYDAATSTMYVNAYEGQVWAIPPSGVATLVVSGLSVRSVWPLGDGRLLIGAASGVYIRQANGALNRITTHNVWQVQPWTNGNFLMTLWGGNALYVVTPTGGTTTLVADSRLGSTLGFTVMPDGSVVAYSNQSPAILLRYSPTGQLLDLPVPSSPVGGLGNSIPYKGGFLLSSNVGLFYYNKDWVAERWSHQRAWGVVQLPGDRVVVSMGGTLYEVQDNAAVDAAATNARIDAVVAKASDWFKANAGVASNNNIDLAFRLIGLGNLKAFYKGTANETSYDSLMQNLGATLRSRQKAAGGWIWREGVDAATKVDPMVTAIVGIALDSLNPSKDSPEVRNAVQYLLNAQSATDDFWRSVVPWNDGAGLASEPLLPSTWVEIWLPTMLERLGGIDTDLSVTFPANVVMSNPDKPVTTATPNADGSTTYVWKLTGVTESSQQVNFDATLKGMQVDETRAVAQSANLVFNNTFVSGTVTAQIDVPKVSVGTSVTQALSTNKPTYTDADIAVFTSAVTNAGAVARDAQVRFTVSDASGQVVDVLPLTPVASVPGAGTRPIQASWPAAGVLSGAYRVKAEVLSPAGVLYSTATANFSVVSGGTRSDGARIGTDRASYSGAQSVEVTSRVSNLTGNTLQENLQAVTVVTGAGNQGVFSKAEAIDQLAPSTQRSFGYSLAGTSLSPGTYQASVNLLDAQGHTLAQSTTAFTVLGTDQTGVGLTGQLTAPPSVFIGQPAAISLAATNGGSTALANTPLTIRVIDPASGNVLASFTQTVSSWPVNGTQSIGWSWPAQGADGQTVVASATATVAGREVPVGQASIRLVGIPKLTVQPAQLAYDTIYVGEKSTAQAVTINSVGTAAASSVTTALTGMDPTQFVITNSSCDASVPLAIGASCTFSVAYQPTQVAKHAAQAKVSFAGGEDLLVPVSGEAKPIVVGGALTLPARVIVGQDLAIGWNVSNPAAAATTATLTLSVIDADGQTLASWPIDAALQASGTQGGTQAYTTSGLPRMLQVVLTQDVQGTPTPIAQGQVEVFGVPQLVAQPAPLTFAPIYPGEGATQATTISSVGTLAAGSLTYALSGADATQFLIRSGGCTQLTSIAIGGNCLLTISYQPTAAATHNAQLHVGYGDGKDLVVNLTGQAKPVVFTGSINADPNPVEAGMPASVSYSVANPAAASEPFSGTLLVAKPGGQALASWPVSATIGANATIAGNRTFSAPLDPQILSVSLSQITGTGTLTLSSTTLPVIDPPIPVTATGGIKGQARILVLVSCPPGLGTAEDAACVQQRSQAITAYLTALGYTNKVVTTGDDFLAQMRCGSYDTYWLSGGAIKLSAQAAEELREAVWRGEALWTDGLHDSRNSLLYDAQGVKQIGKLPAANQDATLAAPGIYGNAGFATLGTVTKFQLTSGQTQGLFTQVPGEQSPVPAVIANAYGQGNSLLFAFDLAAMITQDANRANAQLANFVITSAAYSAGATPTLTIGDVTQVELSVTNQSTRTVTFRVQATLPAGLVSLETAPNAQLVTNVDGSVDATWTYTAAAGGTQVIDWVLRAQQPGSYSVPFKVYSLPLPGSVAPPKLRATSNVDVLVKDAAGLLQQAQIQVSALQPTASNDKSNLTKAQSAVAQAQSYHAQGNYEGAIAQWIAAADAIGAIASVDVSAARTAVSMALEASTDAACIQKCGSAACQ